MNIETISLALLLGGIALMFGLTFFTLMMPGKPPKDWDGFYY